jgi:hypothetical protein
MASHSEPLCVGAIAVGTGHVVEKLADIGELMAHDRVATISLNQQHTSAILISPS